MSRFAVAKEQVLTHLDELVRELMGSNAESRHKRGSMWHVRNPWRGKSKPDQMVIWLSGDRRGAWKDFVSGDKGDAIDLVAFAREGEVSPDSRMRAVQWVEDRFGLGTMDPAARAKSEQQAKLRREQSALDETRRRSSNRDRVRKSFYAGEAKILGTVVETYLKRRGISLSEVPHLSTSFRFRPDCEYWPGAPRDGEGNRLGPAPKFPALISAMVTGDGLLSALHYTFLEPDGSQKLDTRGRGYCDGDGQGFSAKLMYPETSGLVVRVTYGPTGLKCEDAGQRGATSLLGLTEGFEDALSAAVAHPELRMHMAGSLSGLLTVPDINAASGYLIFKDNDWGKPQATKLFNRAMARFRSFGKPLEALAMPADWGKDVNDALRS